MREFQTGTNGQSFHDDDRTAIFAMGSSAELAAALSWIAENHTEKDIAKHFPGIHFENAGMNLDPAFKQALREAAEKSAAKLHIGTDNPFTSLRWMMAKAVAADPTLKNAIPEHLQDMVNAARPFSR